MDEKTEKTDQETCDLLIDASVDPNLAEAFGVALRRARWALLDVRLGTEQRIAIAVVNPETGRVAPVAFLVNDTDLPRLTWHGQHLDGVTPEKEVPTGLYL